jgi:uncharacterized cupin superfamily protein
MGPHDGVPDRGKRTSAIETGRLACIANWRGNEEPQEHYPGDPEPMATDVDFSMRFGITRIGIYHDRLPPGTRSSYPHAESLEEEFAFILAGEGDAWIDGHLHRVSEGDSIAFPAGTGISHTFLNNGDSDLHILSIDKGGITGNRLFYPLNPDLMAHLDHAWNDAPRRPLGPHDGKPARKR